MNHALASSTLSTVSGRSAFDTNPISTVQPTGLNRYRRPRSRQAVGNLLARTTDLGTFSKAGFATRQGAREKSRVKSQSRPRGTAPYLFNLGKCASVGPPKRGLSKFCGPYCEMLPSSPAKGLEATLMQSYLPVVGTTVPLLVDLASSCQPARSPIRC